MNYRLWVNDERTVLVRLWEDGTCETATREASEHTWGPPVYLHEETQDAAEPPSRDAYVKELERRVARYRGQLRSIEAGESS